MSIHVLFIDLIVGFAIVAALVARGRIRAANTRYYASSYESHLSSIWIYGTGAAIFVTVMHLAYIEDSTTHKLTNKRTKSRSKLPTSAGTSFVLYLF